MKPAQMAVGAMAALLLVSAAAWAQIARTPAREVPIPVPAPAPAAAPLILDSKTIALGEAFTDLPAAKDRIFRMRRIELAPGASLPMQAHVDLPAIYYVAQGVVLERRKGQAEPIERQTGDSVLANAETVNSWENIGARPVTLLIAEILPPNSAQ